MTGTPSTIPQIPNEMILASAGSGKTFQLTNRYIALMALQLRSGLPVHPERIIAVTFTRKAAGEFFDAILVKLAKAATDPGYAAALAGGRTDLLSQALTSLRPEDFRELLRLFIQRMPRLFLGTLDSFFSSVLRSFPAEFGLTSDFEVMDEYRAANAVDRVYEAVFTHRTGGNEGARAQQSAFLEAFRQATYGREESNVIQSLDRFVSELHPLYLGAPAPEYWGEPDTIWKDGDSRWLAEGIDPAKEFERLYGTFEAIPEQVSETYWDEFRDEVADHRAGSPFGKRTKYMLERIFPAWKDLENGHASIKFNRRVHEFDPLACESVRKIVQWLVGGEIQAKLRRTRGVWELLDLYEKTYADSVRRRGQLTFQDVQILLSGHHGGGDRNAPILTQTPGEGDRLRIDYRLDARYDHWLLDEFQDTNFIQWKVIANLIDEVIQDTSGTRSLFQVGDIKQAIYGWRGGDTRLFSDIYHHYNSVEERIQRRQLDVSYRSVADILAPVNQIFGDKAALSAIDLPEETIQRWEWGDHLVASHLQGKPGLTMLLNPLPSGENAKPDSNDLDDLILGVLREVDPTRRGLSCAILVRSNKRGNEIVDFLRASSDIPVVSEAEQHIASDNPVNLLLMSLFQLAAHPGDTFAWEHLKLTPYRTLIERDGMSAGLLAKKIASEVFEDGFETVARRVITTVESLLPESFDGFTRSRAEAFTLAARLYDETGSRDLDDFLSYAGRHSTRESVDRSAVQVMTYHKSKGLTFDMVILPDLKSDSLTAVRLGIEAETNAARGIEWVLDLPSKDIVDADPVLSRHLAAKEVEAAYESLCLYYVGMTRARYGNYLLTLPQGPKSRSQNFVKLLEQTLADEMGEAKETSLGGCPANLLYQSNTPHTDRRWYTSFTLPAAGDEEISTAPKDPSTAPVSPLPRFRPSRRTPSGSEIYNVTAGQIFGRDSSESRDFGTLVHALFESIEWVDENTPTSLREAGLCLTGGEASALLDAALAQVGQSLAHPSISRLFAPPSKSATVWREKCFEILLGDEWLSGIFDRVVIESNEAGNPTGATVIDFKTDQVQDDVDAASVGEKYRPQLETYREVLACITGLPQEKIRLILVFTRLPGLTEW